MLVRFLWLLTPFLPLLWLYRVVVAIRNFCYDHGIFKSTKLPALVISIGNLSVGGTGKTPAAIFLANALRDAGWRVAIVARGYRRQKRGLVVVSDGQHIIADIHAAGDEPLLMAQACAGVPVVVDRQKKVAAMAAVERFAPDLIIIDDGFQHRQLHRDLDVVMLDATTTWRGGWLFSATLRREPDSALRRADFIIINKSGQNDDKLAQRLAEQCRRYTDAPIFSGGMKAVAWQVLERAPASAAETLALAHVKDQPVLLVSGIARPERFRRLVEAQGARVQDELTFSDHYRYEEKDVRIIRAALQACAARFVLTTTKDAVKLANLDGGRAFDPALPVLVLETAFEAEPAFLPALRHRIRAQKVASS